LHTHEFLILSSRAIKKGITVYRFLITTKHDQPLSLGNRAAGFYLTFIIVYLSSII